MQVGWWFWLAVYFAETLCYRYSDDLYQNPGMIRMTQNTLNPAKFYQLRRSPVPKNKTAKIASAPFSKSIQTRASVICTNDEIGIRLNEPISENVHVFASGRSDVKECGMFFSFVDFDPIFKTKLEGSCGVQRKYKGSPFFVIEYQIRIILSYNSKEVTEFDRIYDVTCSQSTSRMEVESYYDIRTFDPNKLKNPRRPQKCYYSLHNKAVNGPMIKSANVGDLIFHQWKCTSDEFFFKVYDCQVRDEHNRTYTIIDDRGCSLDEDIIPTPEYDLKNGMIYTPSKAFRFASSSHIHFNCMISLCSKDDVICSKNIPPNCRRKHNKRQLSSELSIEERLWKIHKLLNNKNNNDNGSISASEKVYGSIETKPIVVNRQLEEHVNYEHIINTYRIWTWILCSLNIILVIVSIVITFRLLKNQYIMDIKDKNNAIFKRFPF